MFWWLQFEIIKFLTEMDDSCTFTSMDATSLAEFVGKTVVVRTKQQHTSRGVVHTVDPVTKRYGRRLYRRHVRHMTIILWCRSFFFIYRIFHSFLFSAGPSETLFSTKILMDIAYAYWCWFLSSELSGRRNVLGLFFLNGFAFAIV